ncbi:lipase 3-like isoform X2 [Cryptotermes secundus]|uniref:lipase 3-like isoform X2 n=1 Tax=Cryptotermes secundus TaxID=105785 RepID=UPI000CD7B05A|nr:lipase 3-like isoform X2 [Cryptotermes secundus]
MRSKSQQMCAAAIWTACLVTEIHFRSASAQLNFPYKKLAISDGQLTTPQLITKYSYPEETHKVRTADGYVLTVHRIPHTPTEQQADDRPPVLLLHGLLGSSADWVIAGPHKGLAFVLTDAGYDVWLGNARGNTYSRRHDYLTTRDKAFWNFSWHEMGVYDLPAMIDHVLAVSNKPSLYYVGHSMGCTMFFVLTSSLPHYNSKIRIMFGFAPAAFNSHVKNDLFSIAQFSRVGSEVDSLYNSEFFPNNWMRGRLVQRFCRDGVPTQGICSSVLFLLGGLNSTQLNTTLLPVIFSNFPAGCSLKSWIHYGQQMRSGRFRQYDHGTALNLKHYGTPEPPDYNLAAITAPDVTKLYRALPNAVGLFRVPLSTFGHFDFLWGLDANNLLYDFVISLMKRF